MTVEDPRLAQIRALCDSVEAAQDSLKQTPMVFTSRIRAVLDAAPVAATLPQGIDRDALRQRLCEWEAVEPHEIADGLLDDILALVRPVEGVTLTPEECADLWALIEIATQGATVRNEQFIAKLRALAARLREAAQ